MNYYLIGKLLLILPIVKAFISQSSLNINRGGSDTSLNSFDSSRRNVFAKVLKGGTALITTVSILDNNNVANALDMDAFMNSELDKDLKNCDPKKDPKCIPKLSTDEALCKYGQTGKARSDACNRVKASGKELPTAGKQGKSLGGAYAM